MSKNTVNTSELVAVIERQSKQIDQLLGLIASNMIQTGHVDSDNLTISIEEEVQTEEEVQIEDSVIPTQSERETVVYSRCKATAKSSGRRCKNKGKFGGFCKTHAAKSVPNKANVWIIGNKKGLSLQPYFDRVNTTIDGKAYTNKVVCSGMRGKVLLAKLYDLGYYAVKANNHKVKKGESLPFKNNNLIMKHDTMPVITVHSEFGKFDESTGKRTRANRYFVVGVADHNLS